MKRYFLLIALLVTAFAGVKAQDGKGSFSVGADLYNRYVWRGTDFGNSPVVQPTIEYSYGGFSIGAWGSYSLSANTSGTEADLYAGYSFEDLGLSFVLTDYYFPGDPTVAGSYFDYDNSHTFEIGATKTFGSFYINGNYYMNQMNDMYFEAGFSLGSVDIFAGAGDQNYSSDGDFALVNVGLSTSKDIKITDSFSLPLSGSVILNPDTEQLFLVVGFSF